MFVQNFIKMRAAVRELSRYRKKTPTKTSQSARYRADSRPKYFRA